MFCQNWTIYKEIIYKIKKRQRRSMDTTGVKRNTEERIFVPMCIIILDLFYKVRGVPHGPQICTR